jgi:glycosyltransferase involved in cell wall biosynthesis
LRLAAYSDFPYRRHEDRVYAEQAFVLFLLGMRGLVESLVLIGRLDPEPAPWHFQLPDSVEYRALPYYRRLSRPAHVVAVLLRSARLFWRSLDDVDTVWLFGPNPLAVLFTVLAMLRRRRVALGVRQDYVAYIRNRHPDRRMLRGAAYLFEGAFRLLGRRCAVVVVGPRLAEHYASARELLSISVTLVGEQDLLAHEGSPASMSDRELVVLSVGRLDKEKNPLLLADVLALLAAGEGSWRLVVCGEGPLAGALEERLRAHGLADRAEIRGFVPVGPSLSEVYRNSDLFLHVSLTEGVPQVLFEAFAAGLAVVATDVGAVSATAGDAALLVPPRDARAAEQALRRLVADPQLRIRMAASGLRIARAHTREAQCKRVVEFLERSRPAAEALP